MFRKIPVQLWLKKKVKANLKFDLPEENDYFELALYGAQSFETLKQIRERIKFLLEQDNTPNQKRQVLGEINNIINDEILANGVAHLF